jgi:hypothetical protein
MDDNCTVKLELPAKDASPNTLFGQHSDVFASMVEAGVFDIRYGEVILVFNVDGVLVDTKMLDT